MAKDFPEEEVASAVSGLRQQHGDDWYKHTNIVRGTGTTNRIFENRAGANLENKGWLSDRVYSPNANASDYIQSLEKNKLISSGYASNLRDKANRGVYQTSDDVFTDAVTREKNTIKDEYNIAQSKARKETAASAAATPPPTGKSVNTSTPSDEEIRAARSAGARTPNESATEESATSSEKSTRRSAQDVANAKSINQWIRKNKTGQFDDFADYINEGDTQESVLKSMYDKNQYVQQAMKSSMGKDATWEDFKGLKPDEQLKMINTGKDLRVNSPGTMDYINYHKIPQMAAGIGTTAWLVSRLDSSKGQMSNAQLYGQQQQY
jgi:hypothetical protein